MASRDRYSLTGNGGIDTFVCIAADVGGQVRANLKRIETQLINAGLMLCYNIQFFNE